ncbi:MAG: hypothetical protein JF567_03045 [Xanthomonadales bacterium]|nr:hypothetical protein [Xanthomonadales bacterium]
MKTTFLFASIFSLASVTALVANDASAQQRGELGTINVKAPPKPFTGQRAINLLALETDLTPRQTRMVVQHNPAEYYHFMSEIKADRQFRQALGDARATAYFNGEPIELYSDKVKEAARAMTAQQSPQSSQGVTLAVEWPSH